MRVMVSDLTNLHCHSVVLLDKSVYSYMLGIMPNVKHVQQKEVVFFYKQTE